MSKAQLTDQQIVHHIKIGDNLQALKQVYKDNYGSIEYFILQHNGKSSDAKDIFQEAVIVFYTNVLKSDFKLRSTIKTYLYAVTRNLWFKQLKKHKKTVSLNDEVFERSTEEPINSPLEVDEQEQSLLKTLEKMGPPCKTILYQYYFHEQSIETIATTMNYTSAANARNQKYKCMKRLQKVFLK